MVPGKTHKTGRQSDMSEPLTSHEIEDVLSSIRRLVSEDLRPARAAMAAAPEARAGEAAPEAGKLLLTPALRVVSAEPEDAAAPAWPEPETAALADLADAPALEEAVPAAIAPADEAYDEVYDDAGMAEAVSGLTAGEGEVLWASAGEETEAAEPAAGPAPLHGHWTAQEVPGLDWVQEETDWVEPEPVAFVAHPRKPELTEEPLARAWADRAEAAVRAELDDTLAATAETVVPPRVEPEAAVSEGTGLFDGESGIDEEMLREIVRDIIREELAGTLGERITRNVRKLVRVEINRALTAREFE